MSQNANNRSVDLAQKQKMRIYYQVGFMGLSAIVLSAAIIVWYNNTISSQLLTDFATKAEVAAITLMPYMISAVIAALTSIGAMSILPKAHYVEPTVTMVESLRQLAKGDLTTRLQLKSSDPLRDIANEMNMAVASVDKQITQWKVINRVQWGNLCRIRMAAEQGDCDDVLHFCEEMEKHWDKIAEIEQSLHT